MTEASLISEQKKFYDELCVILKHSVLANKLLPVTIEVMSSLLRRKNDEMHRDAVITYINKFFTIEHDKSKLLEFSKKIILNIIVQRALIAGEVPVPVMVAGVDTPVVITTGVVPEKPEEEPKKEEQTVSRRRTDVPWQVRPLGPTSIVVPEEPEPVNCESYKKLLDEALAWKISNILTFFQRRNPEMKRDLPSPFLLNPDFNDKLIEVARDQITPVMIKNSRSVRMFETRLKLNEVDSATFWEIAEREHVKDVIETTWQNVWNHNRPVMVEKKVNGESKISWKITNELKAIREQFNPVIEKLNSQEIDIIISLVCEGFNRTQLEHAWTKLRQLYEQEMHRRDYQSKARDGALRDSLLDCFDNFPDRVGEFLVMLCYYNFPKISLRFLINFTKNKGTTYDQRRERIPYLMKFLDHPDVLDIMELEDKWMEKEGEIIKLERKDRFKDQIEYSTSVSWKKEKEVVEA